jgi:tRNA1Val (adenine37-N6)-methyltransferase
MEHVSLAHRMRDEDNEDDDGEEVGMGTEDFAEHRTDIGKKSFKYNGFTIVDFAPNPFRDFKTDGDKKFLQDVMSANLATDAAWPDFVEAINNGSLFSIITARGHNPITLMRGVKKLIDSNRGGIDSDELYESLVKMRENAGEKPQDKETEIMKYLKMCRFYPVSYGEGSATNPEVAKIASENFQNSPFKNRLDVIQTDVSEYVPDLKYDFICSNPPFFTNHLASTDAAKHMAIHADHLSPIDLAKAIDTLLNENGKFAVLYPADVLAQFEQSLNAQGLCIHEKVTIHSNPFSPVLRVMASGSREKSPIKVSRINIKTDQGDYTPEFIELLRPYYIIFPS